MLTRDLFVVDNLFVEDTLVCSVDLLCTLITSVAVDSPLVTPLV